MCSHLLSIKTFKQESIYNQPTKINDTELKMNKKERNNEYIRRFRRAIHYEILQCYEQAMVEWAFAEIISPNKKERMRASDRKLVCFDKSNSHTYYLLNDNFQ